MSKRILIAPLNWGLGHAARCIPIVNALKSSGFQPVIASDGFALSLLEKEFPDLESIELPSYNIEYSKKGSFLKWKLFKGIPKMLKAIKAENKLVQQLVATQKIDGIISDNRFGVYSKRISCVFITHQLNVLSGNSTWLSTKLHQQTMKNFDVCWVPDNEGDINLSGKLGHTPAKTIPTKYIGPLSRFRKIDIQKKYDLMVLLSGPEPQRRLLEEKLLSELIHYKGKVIFIKGVIEPKQKYTVEHNIKIYNYMTSSDLETAMNESELVLARSGYTTIMDLAKLKKKAFFIPTPGQYEQIYLAEKLKEDKVATYCFQDDFTIEKLSEATQFKGFSTIESPANYKALFSLFQSE